MANVVQLPIGFYSRPTTSHNSKPFGFDFGLGTGSPMTPGHTQPSSFHQLASSINNQSPQRAQKRRHEPETDEDRVNHARDQSMDRSPTPERPKRAAPKRARVQALVGNGSKDEASKENKSVKDDGEDVDVGVLLASLPPQSLLSLLNSLLNTQPTLKNTILRLIPRPTLETALHALAQSAKKLRDAYPYSNTNAPLGSLPQIGSPSTSFGFGSGYANSRASTFGTFSRPSQSPFGPPQVSGTGHTGGMRDSYILSRLRPHIHEFVSACMSYLPYFSYIPTTTTAPSFQPLPSFEADAAVRSHSMVIQSSHKERSHPNETYTFLSALTTHLITQPILTQSSLAPLLLPRLLEEWKAWVDRVDEIVNHEAGMFGSETVSGWVKGLDEFAEKKGPEGFQGMKEVRDRWIGKVGWLVRRMPHHPMEEEDI